MITCGDDKTIKVSLSKNKLVFLNLRYHMLLTKPSNVTKVWDAATGIKQYTFEGHEAPVYSVCPHYKENIQVFVGYGTFDRIHILV